MTEPDVVLTDYLLAAESLLFAWLLSRPSSIDPGVRDPFVVFFIATAVASLAGGTVHGFFLSDTSLLGVALWRGALVALGVAAACAWIIGARLLFAERLARGTRAAAIFEAIAYAVVIAGIDDRFSVAVFNYLPATIFLTFAFASVYWTSREPALALGVAGLVSTLIAAMIQQFRVALHPRYFNHNALYHVVQAAALFMIFEAAQSLSRPTL